MKTDKELYKLFASEPELLFECAGIKISGSYEMKSVTFKEFEQRSDGFLEPDSDKEPVYIAEFQAYKDDAIYHRVIMEMAAYGKIHPGKDVRGIIVFTTSKFDPETMPWHELSKSDKNLLNIVYLDDFLDKLEQQEPDHPLVAVFKPWRIEDTEILRKNAKTWYKNIEKSKLDKDARENFYSVFIRWMQERFKNLKYEEILNMFVEMTPLEETVSYKEIFAKGMADGKTLGKTEGKTEGRYETIGEELERLRLLRDQNVLTLSVYEILSGPLKKELKYLETLQNMKRSANQ